MNLESELVQIITLLILGIAFSVRSYFIRKRVINIYDRIRKVMPTESNEIDFTSLQPAIKYSSTEKILSKIEACLTNTEK